MTTKTSSSPSLDFLETVVGPMSFGKMIEAIRMTDEVSQVSLAKKLGISRAHLCDIEKGRRSVSAKRAAQFARALGYPGWIFLQTALEDQVRDAGLRFKVTVRAA